MDECVDCGRRLRDLVCGTCRMIYVHNISSGMTCHNCGMKAIRRVHRARTRYQCQYCSYRYFATAYYDSSYKEKLHEYINALERECTDCGCTMTINPQNKELVCKNCGLVYEFPIYTQL